MKMVTSCFTTNPSSPSLQRSNLKGSPRATKKEDLELALRLIGSSTLLEEEEEAMIIDSEIFEDFEGISSLEEELREAFGVFDADGDGRISAKELHGVFLSLGDKGCTIEECRRMIDLVAPQGGGFVGFADFVRMMS